MNTTTVPSSYNNNNLTKFKSKGDPHVFIPGFLGGAGTLRTPQNHETHSISLTNKLKSTR